MNPTQTHPEHTHSLKGAGPFGWPLRLLPVAAIFFFVVLVGRSPMTWSGTHDNLLNRSSVQ